MTRGRNTDVKVIKKEGVDYKKCVKCKLLIPLTSFYKSNLGIGGRTTRCKKCVSEDRKHKPKKDKIYPESDKFVCKILTDTGMSKSELANFIGVHQSYISHLVNYENIPHKTMMKILKAFNIPIEELGNIDNLNFKNLISDNIKQRKSSKNKVYFIRECGGGNIKIGVTKNIKQRIAAMETNIPFDIEVLLLMEGGYYLEKQLHEMFNEYRIEGKEWFKPNENILSYIKKHSEKVSWCKL